MGRSLRIIVAPDSFKGSLGAGAVAEAIGAGIRDVLPDASVLMMPVADGGEGLLDVLIPVLGGELRSANVTGPLPAQTVTAAWGYVGREHLAVIEMARAAGLMLVPPDRRDPRITTSYGFGELIRAALEAGAMKVLLGIGGTATNDGGAGVAQALGVRLLDDRGNPVGRGGIALGSVRRIDLSHIEPALTHTSFVVASDVASPLTGPLGASYVYGPQKGATPAIAQELDRCLENFRQVLLSTMGIDVQEIPGSGAAGGAGAALAVFCKAEMRPGIDVVLDAIHFDDNVRGADLVITGEGCLDDQTSSGKAMAGVLRRARSHSVPVAAVVGSVEGDPARFKGADKFCEIRQLVDDTVSVEAAIKDAGRLVRLRAARLLRDLHPGGGIDPFVTIGRAEQA
jgi:glycerate 2-kinase